MTCQFKQLSIAIGVRFQCGIENQLFATAGVVQFENRRLGDNLLFNFRAGTAFIVESSIQTNL